MDGEGESTLRLNFSLMKPVVELEICLGMKYGKTAFGPYECWLKILPKTGYWSLHASRKRVLCRDCP